MLARSLRILLAVALLVAWQKALVHPVEHVDAAGAFIHLADGHEGDHRKGNAGDPLCDAVAAVAACVSGAPVLAFLSLPGASAPDAPLAREQLRAPPLAYRSQAPPQHS
jgi:hypothetical protein